MGRIDKTAGTNILGLTKEKPKTKTGLIRCHWSEIKQALNSGYTIKEICQDLNSKGVSIQYSRLRYLVACLRKTDISGIDQTAKVSDSVPTKSAPVTSDVGAILRAQRAKKIKFDHNPFSTRIKTLI